VYGAQIGLKIENFGFAATSFSTRGMRGTGAARLSALDPSSYLT
jgi:hypothetical protein